MAANLTNLKSGQPGDISRAEGNFVPIWIDGDTNTPAAFGVAVKMVNGKAQTIEAGDTENDFYTVLCRNIPAEGNRTDNQTFGSGVPNPQQVARGIRGFGYCIAPCVAGTPARGGDVFMVVNTAGGDELGQFRATADGANTVRLNGVAWAVDNNDTTNFNSAEIEFLGATNAAGVTTLTDPGDAGAIPSAGYDSGYVSIVTAGAETRTVADPTRVGQRLTIGFQTDGGDAVITFASPLNQTGNTIATGADAGDVLDLVAIADGADIEWRVVGNDGWALS